MVTEITMLLLGGLKLIVGPGKLALNHQRASKLTYDSMHILYSMPTNLLPPGTQLGTKILPTAEFWSWVLPAILHKEKKNYVG
eukprot:1160127-Pelagomonas_calceolata.AAC.13